LGVRVPPGLLSIKSKESSQSVARPGRLFFPVFLREEKLNKIVSFITEARDELKKVHWPTRKELIDSTKVVIIASVFLVLFIGLVDYILSKILNLILG
jgi:preprotein translocase subunit SecE